MNQIPFDVNIQEEQKENEFEFENVEECSDDELYLNDRSSDKMYEGGEPEEENSNQ